MTIAAGFFYLFSAVLILCGVLVITVRHPVHAVLFLILAFFNAAGLFVLLGAEFLAMILVIVYVGAVAVLFLFVVMMLDVDFAALRGGFSRYLPIGLAVGAVLLTELILVAVSWTFAPHAISPANPGLAGISNTMAIGRVLYTQYVYFFQIAGMILLVAMIGAIVLTLRVRPKVKRQTIAVQVARRREQSIEVVHVETGRGLQL
jgi:NADH-quinone oxidoreductase subunit J